MFFPHFLFTVFHVLLSLRFIFFTFFFFLQFFILKIFFIFFSCSKCLHIFFVPEKNVLLDLRFLSFLKFSLKKKNCTQFWSFFHLKNSSFHRLNKNLGTYDYLGKTFFPPVLNINTGTVSLWESEAHQSSSSWPKHLTIMSCSQNKIQLVMNPETACLHHQQLNVLFFIWCWLTANQSSQSHS